MAGFADIGIYDHQSVGDIVDSLNRNTQFETEQKNREDEQRRKFALNSIFSKHIDNKGNLNERAFYTEASQAGLDPTQIGQAIDYHNKQIEQMSKIANEQPAQRMQGYDPNAAGRNNAQYGETDAGSIIPGMVKTSSPSSEGNGAPDGPSTLDLDKLRLPSVVADEAEARANGIAPVAPQANPANTAPNAPIVGTETTALDRLRAMRKSQIKEVQRELGFEGKQIDGKVGSGTAKRLRAALTAGTIMEGSNLGDLVSGTSDAQPSEYANEQGGQVAVTAPTQSKGEEAKMAPDTVGPDVFTPAPEDNRTFTQKFEDSYRKENSLAGQAGANGATEAPDSLFTWEPKNDGSNAFLQYQTALESKLKANGFEDASSFLHQIYGQAMKQNMPTAPNEGLLAMGKEGIAKYRGEQRAYQAGLAKAQGAAEEAVTKAKEGLAEFAKGYGVSAQTNEKFEADMGGRRKGAEQGSEIVRLRPVSEAEKTRGENIGNAYLDLKSSKDVGGFEGAYGMAMAKAKADGNVNRDVIVANLIAMGAVPDNKAIYVKSVLDASGNPVGDAWNQLKGLAGTLITDESKQKKWYDSATQNMKDAMRLVGYGVTGPKPAPKQEGTGTVEGGFPAPKPEPKKTAADRARAKSKGTAKKASRGTVD